MASNREPDLGPAELEVLRALWDQGDGSVRHVMNHLRERGRELAYTTVQTLLTRLEQKRFVKSDKSELAYVYRAQVSREQVSASRLKTLAHQFYDGAAGPLVLQLVESQGLTSEEIAELQALIEGLDKRRPRGGKRQRRE